MYIQNWCSVSSSGLTTKRINNMRRTWNEKKRRKKRATPDSQFGIEAHIYIYIYVYSYSMKWRKKKQRVKKRKKQHKKSTTTATTKYGTKQRIEVIVELNVYSIRCVLCVCECIHVMSKTPNTLFVSYFNWTITDLVVVWCICAVLTSCRRIFRCIFEIWRFVRKQRTLSMYAQYFNIVPLHSPIQRNSTNFFQKISVTNQICE